MLMLWIKRLLLAAPFIVALLLNTLMVRADHLHLYRESQHIAGYGFLFGKPWSWIMEPRNNLVFILVQQIPFAP